MTDVLTQIPIEGGVVTVDLTPVNTALLAAFASATFAASAPPPPPEDWVYHAGVFGWAGDWSGIPGIDYKSTLSLGVDGVSPCIMIPSAGEWEMWIPYPPITAGSPATNGIGCNLTGKTTFTIAIKPTKAGLSVTMQFFQANASTTDVVLGNSITLNQAKYGPAVMVVGEWNLYTVPLADFGIGTPGWIYKFLNQQQGTTPQQWFIDQVGFS